MAIVGKYAEFHKSYFTKRKKALILQLIDLCQDFFYVDTLEPEMPLFFMHCPCMSKMNCVSARNSQIVIDLAMMYQTDASLRWLRWVQSWYT